MRFLFVFIFFAVALSFSYKGQLWFDSNFSDHSDDITFYGYIPELSILAGSNVDFEWSQKITYTYSKSLNSNKNKNYRLWIRYTKPKYNVRAGIQKISFGTASLFRPLNWFDTIDFTSTTGQTDGVKAIRGQFFPSHSSVLSIWCIDGEKISCGSRIEFIKSSGSFGLSYHNDQDNSDHEVFKVPQILESQPAILFPGKNHRFGFDYRYDGVMGLWIESASILSSINDLNLIRYDMFTLGADYTLPVLNGLLFSSESMYFSIVTEDKLFLHQTTSSFILSMPIGMLNDIMYINIKDWETNDTYNVLKWSTTFDYFSIDCMASVNPSGISDNFKIMFIYNH